MEQQRVHRLREDGHAMCSTMWCTQRTFRTKCVFVSSRTPVVGLPSTDSQSQRREHPWRIRWGALHWEFSIPCAQTSEFKETAIHLIMLFCTCSGSFVFENRPFCLPMKRIILTWWAVCDSGPTRVMSPVWARFIWFATENYNGSSICRPSLRWGHCFTHCAISDSIISYFCQHSIHHDVTAYAVGYALEAMTSQHAWIHQNILRTAAWHPPGVLTTSWIGGFDKLLCGCGPYQV